MLGFPPVRRALLMLRWLMFWLLQFFLTCKDIFIWSVFDMWPAGSNLQMFHIHLCVVCISSVRKDTLLHLFIPTIQNIDYIDLLTIWLYLRLASEGMMSWMNSGFHSYVNLEVSYMFHKVPTSLWWLVGVRTFLRYFYTCRVQPNLYGNKFSAE